MAKKKTSNSISIDECLGLEVLAVMLAAHITELIKRIPKGKRHKQLVDLNTEAEALARLVYIARKWIFFQPARKDYSSSYAFGASIFAIFVVIDIAEQPEA